MKGDLALFKVFGIDVKIHFSWWIILVLLGWGLASSFFPEFYPGLTIMQYWIIGLVSAFLLFASVLLHELAHSLVAKSRNIGVNSITLFFFGGVAEIDTEDLKPWDEILVASAGPIFSLLLGVILMVGYLNISATSNLAIYFSAITFYLYQINFVLAIFNIIPAYPLDGGRVLRAILHFFTKSLKKSTYFASLLGKGFAWFLGAVGIFRIISGDYGGIWLILLSVFLHFLAGMSFEQVLYSEILKRWSVKDLMEKKFPVAYGNEDLAHFLTRNFSSKYDSFLVVKGNKSKKSKNEVSSFAKKNLLGILDLKKIGEMTIEVEERIKIKDVTYPKKYLKILSPNQKSDQALRSLLKQELTILPVMDKNKVVGLMWKEKLVRSLVWTRKYGVGVKKR